MTTKTNGINVMESEIVLCGGDRPVRGSDQLRASSTNRSQHFICSPFHTYFCRRPPGCLQLYVACRMFPSHFVGTVSIVLINCGPESIVLMSTIHAYTIIEAAGKRCSLIKTDEKKKNSAAVISSANNFTSLRYCR